MSSLNVEVLLAQQELAPLTPTGLNSPARPARAAPPRPSLGPGSVTTAAFVSPLGRPRREGNHSSGA